MFWLPSQNDGKINELLDKDDVKLDEILEQDSLSISIRNPLNRKLFSYFKRPDIIEELLKWTLTEDYKDNPNFFKLANSAVTIFTNSKYFQQIIIGDETFLNRIQDFINSTPQSSRACAHFRRIIKPLIDTTCGDFLKKFNNLQAFLINNITDIALKDLFVSLSIEYTNTFDFNTEILIQLVQKINDDNCFFIISTIRDIILIEDRFKKFFDSEVLIDNLFKIAIEKSCTQPLIATEIFRLLKNFKVLSYYNVVLQKYVESYQYQQNCTFPYAINIFDKLTHEMFDFFFDPKSCSMLVEAIYQSFQQKAMSEQLELTKKANLCERIMESFPNSQTKARFTDLAILLVENFKGSPEISELFIEFVENDVKNHLRIRESEYGGKVSPTFFDDEIDIKHNFQKSDTKYSSSDSSSSSSDSDEEIVLENINDNNPPNTNEDDNKSDEQNSCNDNQMELDNDDELNQD